MFSVDSPSLLQFVCGLVYSQRVWHTFDSRLFSNNIADAVVQHNTIVAPTRMTWRIIHLQEDQLFSKWFCIDLLWCFKEGCITSSWVDLNLYKFRTKVRTTTGICWFISWHVWKPSSAESSSNILSVRICVSRKTANIAKITTPRKKTTLQYCFHFSLIMFSFFSIMLSTAMLESSWYQVRGARVTCPLCPQMRRSMLVYGHPEPASGVWVADGERHDLWPQTI